MPRPLRRERRLLGPSAIGSALLAAGVVVPIITTTPAASAATDPFAQVRQCESGNNYSINTGNGYYGAYQFDLQTWHSLGYPGLPSDAPPAVQDQAARQLQAQRGWAPWPVCGQGLGDPGPAPQPEASTPPRPPAATVAPPSPAAPSPAPSAPGLRTGPLPSPSPSANTPTFIPYVPTQAPATQAPATQAPATPNNNFYIPYTPRPLPSAGPPSNFYTPFTPPPSQGPQPQQPQQPQPLPPSGLPGLPPPTYTPQPPQLQQPQLQQPQLQQPQLQQPQLQQQQLAVLQQYVQWYLKILQDAQGQPQQQQWVPQPQATPVQPQPPLNQWAQQLQPLTPQQNQQLQNRPDGPVNGQQQYQVQPGDQSFSDGAASNQYWPSFQQRLAPMAPTAPTPNGGPPQPAPAILPPSNAPASPAPALPSPLPSSAPASPAPAPPSPPPSSGASATRQAILAFAKAQEGKPYVYGAEGPDSYDCSGLTQAAYAAAGLTLPRTAAGQQGAVQPISKDQAQPGDLVFSNSDSSGKAGHVGIVENATTGIFAPHTGTNVQEQSLSGRDDLGYGRLTSIDSGSTTNGSTTNGSTINGSTASNRTNSNR